MAEGDAAAIYNIFLFELMRRVRFNNNVIKAMLVSDYTPDIDNHQYYVNVQPFEVSGSGYTAKGKTLTNKSFTMDNINDRGLFDADDLTWTNLDVGAISHLILLNDTLSDHLIACWELGRAANGGDYTIRWNSLGIMAALATV